MYIVPRVAVCMAAAARLIATEASVPRSTTMAEPQPEPLVLVVAVQVVALSTLATVNCESAPAVVMVVWLAAGCAQKLLPTSACVRASVAELQLALLLEQTASDTVRQSATAPWVLEA